MADAGLAAATGPEALRAFLQMHDGGEAVFAEALRSGDTSAIEALQSDGYTVYFGRTGEDAALTVDRETANAGMRASVRQAASAGLTRRYAHRVARLAGPDEAAVTFEQVLERGGRPVYRMLVMERWRRVDGRWRIVREYVEPLGPAGP